MKVKNKEIINIAVIGVGNMGRNHVRTYSSIKNVNLVSVSDINGRTGRKIAEEFKCKYYKDYNLMLKRENIDAVSLVLPTLAHRKAALDIIKFKKHLLIEKPIASSVKDAKEIIKAAAKAKIKLTVGHVERFNPAVQELKKIVDKKIIGETISIIAKRVGMFPPQIKDTNVIIDLAVHDIDVFNYLLEQQPSDIFVKGRKTLTNQREDSAEIFLSYNGISGFIQANWITPVKIRTLSITGSKGYAELNYITQKLEFYQSRYKKNVDSFGQFVVRFGEPVKKIIKIDKKEPLLCELESFVECIKYNKEPKITGEDGLKVLMVAEKSIESLKNNKVIRI